MENSLLRLKMLPKLPETTRGICLARIDVAACSRELPQPKLNPVTRTSFGLIMLPNSVS